MPLGVRKIFPNKLLKYDIIVQNNFFVQPNDKCQLSYQGGVGRPNDMKWK